MVSPDRVNSKDVEYGVVSGHQPAVRQENGAYGVAGWTSVLTYDITRL
jgi:hypothetical protein